MEIKELQTKRKDELIEMIKDLERVIDDMAKNIKFIKRQKGGFVLG